MRPSNPKAGTLADEILNNLLASQRVIVGEYEAKGVSKRKLYRIINALRRRGWGIDYDFKKGNTGDTPPTPTVEWYALEPWHLRPLSIVLKELSK